MKKKLYKILILLDIADLLHSDDGSVPIHRFEEGDVGEGEAGHFLEAHISSKVVKLEKI